MTQQPGRARLRSARLLLLAALALVTGACTPSSDIATLTIRNRTDERLTVTLQGTDPANPSQPREVPAIDSAGLFISKNRCRGTGVVAVNEEGREVGRHDQPPCGGDQWIIQRDGSHRYIPSAQRR